MKKLIVAFIFLISANLIFAQYTAKGNFMVGGTTGFSTAKSTVENNTDGVSVGGTRTTQFNLTPNLGYFLTDDFALGLRMDYAKNKIKYNDGSVDASNNSIFGPFVRYYLPTTTNRTLFFGAGVGFGNSSDQIQLATGQQNIENRLMAISGGPGFTIFSNDAIGIEGLVRYYFIRNNSDISLPNQTPISTTINTSQVDFSIGIQFYLSGVRAANG